MDGRNIDGNWNGYNIFKIKKIGETSKARRG
jgi:hypothetical protein